MKGGSRHARAGLCHCFVSEPVAKEEGASSKIVLRSI